jgi:hypothetical protein
MIYKFLPDQLHSTADRIAEFLAEDRGITAIRAEEQIDEDLPYRPTIYGISPEKYIVAVEVQESPNTTSLDSVILDCVMRSVPVKLFVTFVVSASPVPHNLIENAHKKGLGVIEIAGAELRVLREALPLSLLGYRLDYKRFPKKLRSTLIEAGNTFRDGSPAKGCAVVYDEIEDLSRGIIKKTKKKKLWRKLRPGERPSKLNLDDGPWEKVIELFEDFYVVNKKKVPDLTSNLIHLIAAVTSYRNESGHKPKSLADRIRRDKEIRTRFESALDLLFDLIEVFTQIS